MTGGDGSYTVTYPDLPGCTSEGKSLENALYMAQDALCVWLGYLLDEAAKAGDMAEAARVRGLSDDALRRENTGSHVFLSLYGRVMDAMEDFHIILDAQ